MASDRVTLGHSRRSRQLTRQHGVGAAMVALLPFTLGACDAIVGVRDLSPGGDAGHRADTGGEEPRADSATDSGLRLGWDSSSPSDAAGDASCGAQTFTETDTQQNFVVPDNVSYMHVKAWGGGGNGESGCDTWTDGNGGRGGYAEAVFEVTPGTGLAVFVGHYGRSGMTGEDIIKFGFGNVGGGGLSGVFLTSDPVTATDSAEALIIAGGGGSAGAGGCLPGGNGNAPDSGGESSMQGGPPPKSGNPNGGGGGYQGGASPTSTNGSARGGSGFIASSAVNQAPLGFTPPGTDAPPPASTDPEYNGSAGTTESNGLLWLDFTCVKPAPIAK